MAPGFYKQKPGVSTSRSRLDPAQVLIRDFY
jgi:hypothetical protein